METKGVKTPNFRGNPEKVETKGVKTPNFRGNPEKVEIECIRLQVKEYFERD